MSRVLAFPANHVTDRQDTDRDQVRAADACLSRIASRVIGASAKDSTADLRSLLAAERLIAGATTRRRPLKINLTDELTDRGSFWRPITVSTFVVGRHTT